MNLQQIKSEYSFVMTMGTHYLMLFRETNNPKYAKRYLDAKFASDLIRAELRKQCVNIETIKSEVIK